ncbi:MAG TPA: ECF transporter S component [Symbiobacteriaceae bacterium]|jgi:riboflavin transporter FmnP
MTQSERLNRLVRISMLGALAFLLMLLQIHIPPFASFLAYDPGDVPAMVATYTLGPAAGVAVQGIKSVLFLISGRSTAGWVGVMANFLAGAVLVIVAGFVRGLLERAGARHWGWDFVSAAAGTVLMAAIMIPLNATLVYPVWGMKGAAAWSAAVTVSTPFNLFKGFASSVLSLAFYRRLQPFLLGRQAVQKAA